MHTQEKEDVKWNRKTVNSLYIIFIVKYSYNYFLKFSVVKFFSKNKDRDEKPY